MGYIYGFGVLGFQEVEPNTSILRKGEAKGGGYILFIHWLIFLVMLHCWNLAGMAGVRPVQPDSDYFVQIPASLVNATTLPESS